MLNNLRELESTSGTIGGGSYDWSNAELCVGVDGNGESVVRSIWKASNMATDMSVEWASCWLELNQS